MLPSLPPRRHIKLDPDSFENYVGDYEYKRKNIPLTIFKKGDKLFFSNDQETAELFAETVTKFYGTSKEIGDFKANFIKNNSGEIENLSVYVGFGILQFDKVR
jgi:hypothetical protein